MRSPLALLLGLPLLVAASGAVQPQQAPLDVQLKQARAEQAAAERETSRLEQLASQARGDAARLQAQQAAAAQGIEAAEARITASDAQLRLVAALLAQRRQQLAGEQKPLASLLAALATMSQEPPLVAIADRGSVDDLVEVRALLDTTTPVVRARTSALGSQLKENNRLLASLQESRAESVRSRQALVESRQRFASLQTEAVKLAQVAASRALSAGDVGIAAGETVEQIEGGAAQARSAQSLAAYLAAAPPSPARPVAPDSPQTAPPFAYRLPVAAPVTDGLGAVSPSGVRSRGISLAVPRGAAVTSPAGGVVRFNSPFRDYDGVVIIDHGNGWMTLLVNVASPLKPGARVNIGEPIGRALGPLQVELSQNGRRISPALIAGSSETLSKARKGG